MIWAFDMSDILGVLHLDHPAVINKAAALDSQRVAFPDVDRGEMAAAANVIDAVNQNASCRVVKEQPAVFVVSHAADNAG